MIAGVDKESRCAKTYVDNNKNILLDTKFPTYLQRDIFPKTEEYMSDTKYGDLSLPCHRRVNERLNARCFSDV